MTDLLNRLDFILDDVVVLTDGEHDTIVEAKDEIEQLRSELSEKEWSLGEWMNRAVTYKTKLDKVKTKIREWDEAYVRNKQRAKSQYESGMHEGVRSCGLEILAILEDER